MKSVTFSIFCAFAFVPGLISPVMADETIRENHLTLFLAGDVMTGRGIDQVLQYSNNPEIHEPYMKNAKGYVELAEKINGPIIRPVSCEYLWGDALAVLAGFEPHLKMINLETNITTSDDYWKQKYIHYRMHPANVNCLLEAGIDYCSLANNHMLDWGDAGLRETISTLNSAGIRFAGAGMNERQAGTPAIMNVAGKGRVIVFSYGMRSGGVPKVWAAKDNRGGVNYLPDLSDNSVEKIRLQVKEYKEKGDIVVVSLHWGSNWGYDIPRQQVAFAHSLIDKAQVDLLHGHSSHHPRGIEIYKNKLVLYGAGDLLNDYEGISGHEEYRDDLVLMYFASIDNTSGEIVHLELQPMQIKQFSLRHATADDANWLMERLEKASKRFGTRFKITEDNSLMVEN